LIGFCGRIAGNHSHAFHLGDDLQLDHSEKSATLPGLLLYLSEQISETVLPDDLEKLRKTGVNYLKKTPDKS
jgi:hypothetical protein